MDPDRTAEIHTASTLLPRREEEGMKSSVRCTALVALVLPASAGAQQAAANTAMRFQAMDTNHDGVITRDEWRGSDRSFRNHDWNGDGRLSGDEVRVGAPRNSQWDDRDIDESIEQENGLDAGALSLARSQQRRPPRAQRMARQPGAVHQARSQPRRLPEPRANSPAPTMSIARTASPISTPTTTAASRAPSGTAAPRCSTRSTRIATAC